MFGTLESLGIPVFRCEMDIQRVEDFFSGVSVLSGRKLKSYFVEVREASKRQACYESFEWLYE